MIRSKPAADEVIRKVLARGITRAQAARALRVSVRTIHNYEKKYLDHGPGGLVDRRRGHYRKITPEQEAKIIACKLDGLNRSARWIRDRLKLDVSVEAVRLVFLKHGLNRASLESVNHFAVGGYSSIPFKGPENSALESENAGIRKPMRG